MSLLFNDEGNLKILTWWHENGGQICDSTINAAIESGNLEIVKWLNKKGFVTAKLLSKLIQVPYLNRILSVLPENAGTKRLFYCSKISWVPGTQKH